MVELSPEHNAAIELIVQHYIEKLETAERLSLSLAELFSSGKLKKLVHSIKARAKDPEHLRGKLERKMRASIERGEEFDITRENLFKKINDLVGVRLLHLHTSQFADIHRIVLQLLDEEGFRVIEGPRARTWDNEYKRMFEKMGIETVNSERMYTSVHYVVDPGAGTKPTAEIQVRTLAEELWGEVDHTINYPVPCEIPACKEQILVLARVTSSATRLVDSIFFTRDEEAKK
jgi:ppGpp synthetase/RelA/SpoT-type nucleotidyltranferase